MHNDPELNPKYLGTISSDFIKVSDYIKEAAYLIRQRGISDHPVFPVAKTMIPVGALLYEQGQYGNDWTYYISFMEEFVQRELIKNEADFKAVYKDPDEYCCLFVVEPSFTNFIFIPYPED